MSDDKASIKIEFQIYGEKFVADMWINYDGYNDVDDRVLEFFRDSYRQARAKYDARTFEAERAEREERMRVQERATYEMLKKKFDPCD